MPHAYTLTNVYEMTIRLAWAFTVRVIMTIGVIIVQTGLLALMLDRTNAINTGFVPVYMIILGIALGAWAIFAPPADTSRRRRGLRIRRFQAALLLATTITGLSILVLILMPVGGILASATGTLLSLLSIVG